MKCTECGNDLVPDVRDQIHCYRGKAITIPTKGEYCPNCDEAILAEGEWERIDNAVREFRCQVNKNLGEPEFIAEVRRKLHLDQKQAAHLFGGGVNAFSRYELGKAKPPLSLMQLFRILDAHPEMLPLLQKPSEQNSHM